MYIHLGGDKVIRSRELIAIFDLTNGKSANLSNSDFGNAHLFNQAEKIGDEEPKSLVVTDSRVYFSPVSASTLKRRSVHFSS
jgi:hypothetical protein